jgi:hypothetical protein
MKNEKLEGAERLPDGTPPNITVYLTHISGDRFWSFDRDLPPNVHIDVNINILDLERAKGSLRAPFIFTIHYLPSIAQISIKGHIEIKGDERVLSEIERLKGQPPKAVFNVIANAGISEAVILSKSLGVPPPLPSFTPPSAKGGKPPGTYA